MVMSLRHGGKCSLQVWMLFFKLTPHLVRELQHDGSAVSGSFLNVQTHICTHMISLAGMYLTLTMEVILWKEEWMIAFIEGEPSLPLKRWPDYWVLSVSHANSDDRTFFISDLKKYRTLDFILTQNKAIGAFYKWSLTPSYQMVSVLWLQPKFECTGNVFDWFIIIMLELRMPFDIACVCLSRIARVFCLVHLCNIIQTFASYCSSINLSRRDDWSDPLFPPQE